MEISSIFEECKKNIAKAQLYQRDTKKMAEQELNKLSQYEKLLEEKPELKHEIFDGNNMYFRNAKNGQRMPFGHITRNVEDLKKAVTIHQNRQYQLFLAEAYEVFEDFIEDAYAYAGYTDKTLWQCADFGDISITEIEKKTFEDFRKMVKSKREKPKSILAQFRKNFPEIEKLEKEHKIQDNINLGLVINLIEKMRHIIVHNGGKVSSKPDFINEVLPKKLKKNGDFCKKHSEYIKSFFRDEYPNTLILLEVKLLSCENSAYRDAFDNLSGYLMTYAHILLECLETHQKQNNGELQLVPTASGF